MTPYTSLSMRELLDAFASSQQPVPAGGSALALSAATGASLLVMVAGISRTRTGAAAESTALTGAADRLLPLRAALTDLVDRDAHAYETVLVAARLPVTDEAQFSLRQQAFDGAMRTAAGTQLEALAGCREVLREAIVVAEHGARSAQGDVGVAIELLRAAARGASVNVDINLTFIEDAVYRADVTADRLRLDDEIATDAEIGLSILTRRRGA